MHVMLIAVTLILQLPLVAGAEDVLLLKAITEEPPNTTAGLPRPTPGMSRESVKSVFGDPDETTRPVGNPPIYRWVYPDYVVFFEGDFVINTVLKKPNVN